jgi:glucokinase
MSKESGDILTLGVDLGGTKVETALVNMDGTIVAVEKYPTQPAKGSEGVIEDIIQCVKNCLGKASQQARSLGIGVAGQVDKATGMVRFAPNLKWRDVPLKIKLEQALDLTVSVSNDVRAATWGEWQYGAGKGASDLLCLFIGTGIGGGIVSGGRMLEGYLNTAGELGHVPVMADGRQCHCRNRGCLEAYAGGWAIKERAQEAAARDPLAGEQLIKLAGSLENITAKIVTEAYKQKDLLASHLVEETAEFLATGITGFVNAFNPCQVILGGGIIAGLSEYIQYIESKVRARALKAAIEKLSFVPASLEDKSVVIGAAMLAYHNSIQSKR